MLLRLLSGRRRAVGMLTLVVVLTGCTTNSLWDNWSGQPSYTSDTSFAPPAWHNAADTAWTFFGTHAAHSESSTVYFNGTYFMYTREFVEQAPGNTASVRVEIAVSTSTDGEHFTYSGVAIPYGTGVGCGQVYAPSVLVEAARLTMVYEADPNGFGCAGEHGELGPLLGQYVAMAYSTNGTTWTGNRRIIAPRQSWEGWDGSSYSGNTGTPYIIIVPGGYEIGYHGHSASPDRLSRGSVFAGVSATTSITESLLDPARHASPDVFTTQSGGALDPALYGIGFGAANIMQYQGGSGGQSDGGYYMVVEAFAGNSGCTTSKIQTVIARSSNPDGPWAVQDKVLYGQHTGCGTHDLPSWFYNFNTKRYLVTWTAGPATTIQRIVLANAWA